VLKENKEASCTHEGIKLDVGCGPKVREGYLGVDIRPAPHITYCCNAWEVNQFVPENSVTAIYSRHFFEHLTFPQAAMTLKAWMHVLHPGGTIEIIVPDLRFHVEQYLQPSERSITNPKWSNLQHAMAGFYGWQREADVSYWDVHKSGYDFEQLHSVLAEHGFSNINRIPDEPWNLHVEAQKPATS